jgi:ssDNA-binding Zn-finger/Zn-ribbon topoisomerase 1
MKPETRVELLQAVTAGECQVPSCPQCEVKMVLKTAQKPSWGCRNFPACQASIPVRATAN